MRRFVLTGPEGLRTLYVASDGAGLLIVDGLVRAVTPDASMKIVDDWRMRMATDRERYRLESREILLGMG
jgi:hypothetical protein